MGKSMGTSMGTSMGMGMGTSMGMSMGMGMNMGMGTGMVISGFEIAIRLLLACAHGCAISGGAVANFKRREEIECNIPMR
jgi:hypothetical protein